MVQDTGAGASVVMTTSGDMVYYNSGRQRLAKEDNDDVLTLKSGLPSWEASSGGGLDPVFWSACEWNKGAAQTSYFPLDAGDNNNSATESNTDQVQDAAVKIVRMHTVTITAPSSNSTCTLRDDGADAVQLTVTASTTGDYDSGAISVTIAAGSLVNYQMIANGSGSFQTTTRTLEGT